MLTEQEKNEILQSRSNLEYLHPDLKRKLQEAILAGNSPFSASDDDICCDTGLSFSNRYKKMSAQDCKQVFDGTIVDNSHCN